MAGHNLPANFHPADPPGPSDNSDEVRDMPGAGAELKGRVLRRYRDDDGDPRAVVDTGVKHERMVTRRGTDPETGKPDLERWPAKPTNKPSVIPEPPPSLGAVQDRNDAQGAAAEEPETADA